MTEQLDPTPVGHLAQHLDHCRETITGLLDKIEWWEEVVHEHRPKVPRNYQVEVKYAWDLLRGLVVYGFCQAAALPPEPEPITSETAAKNALLSALAWLESHQENILCRAGWEPPAVETPAAVNPARGQEPSGSPALSGKAFEQIQDPETPKIMDIARSGQNVDDKMRAICGVDRRFLAFKSPRWAKLLAVSAAAIRKTDFWKEDRQRAIAADRELKDPDELEREREDD